MSAPSGYTALDFVGFTDKGTYSPIVNYMRNDLVHYGGNIMRCLIDNTLNVTPVVGANWELWVGASANLVERVIAPLENNPADVAFGVGRQIIYDDWLWEVIAPIAVGDALIDYAVDPTNANIKKSAPVETQLLAVKAEADATDNMIAPTEANASSSSAPYSVGDQLILNNILYDVIAAIQIGDALTTGTGGNIAAADTLTDQLNAKANSSDLAAVATSGSYNDLSNKPTLGTAAAKNSTSAVTSGSTDLVESGAVYEHTHVLEENDNAILNVLGAKNLLKINATTQTLNGVTFTVNSDGSITVNGTPSTNDPVIFWLSSANSTFSEDVLLNGLPQGASENTFSYGGSGVGAAYDEKLIRANTNIRVAIAIQPGYTANNLVFKPMIRPASVEDGTYVPYTMTNRELTMAAGFDEIGTVTLPEKTSTGFGSITCEYRKQGSITQIFISIPAKAITLNIYDAIKWQLPSKLIPKAVAVQRVIEDVSGHIFVGRILASGTFDLQAFQALTSIQAIAISEMYFT